MSDISHHDLLLTSVLLGVGQPKCHITHPIKNYQHMLRNSHTAKASNNQTCYKPCDFMIMWACKAEEHICSLIVNQLCLSSCGAGGSNSGSSSVYTAGLNGNGLKLFYFEGALGRGSRHECSKTLRFNENNVSVSKTRYLGHCNMRMCGIESTTFTLTGKGVKRKILRQPTYIFSFVKLVIMESIAIC